MCRDRSFGSSLPCDRIVKRAQSGFRSASSSVSISAGSLIVYAICRAIALGLIMAAFLVGALPLARAQDSSLAGYGGSASMMERASPGLPYSGSYGGFMPFRMRENERSGLGFLSRPSRLGNTSGRPFRLSDSGGMRRKPLFSSFGNAMKTPSEGASMSVMPPNFGYPFRQPPSLADPGSASLGMP